jgi:CheY-like chemotaxis protein
METFAAEPSSTSASRRAVPRLLVVDDELEHAEICAALLHRRGYQVAVALSGRDAIAVARLLRPDLILLDLYMPSLDGISTAEDLRGHLETRAVPIVIVSASGEAIAEARAAALGIVGSLAKPFRAAELIACVERALPGALHA